MSASPSPVSACEKSAARWFIAGLRAAAGLPAIVLAATFVGIGSICADYGMSLAWTLTATMLLWAGPAHIVLVGGLGAGAPWFALAITVGLTSVRLLPMVVALTPFLRSGGARLPALLFASHFVAISIWVEGMRLLPGVPARGRLPFYHGLAGGLLAVATLMTAVGYIIAGVIPPLFGAGLLFLTPIFFLVSLLGPARTTADYLPVLAGFFGLLAAAPFAGGLELLFAGVGGGTLAFFAGRALERRRA